MAKSIGDLRVELEAIDNVSAVLNKISKNLKQFSDDAKKNSGSFDNLSSSLGNVGKQSQKMGDLSTAGMLKLGGSAALAFVGIQSITTAISAMGKSMVTSASNLEQNRVAFETMLGSADQARIMMKQISDFAMKTPFNLPDVQQGAKSLLAYGISAEKIIPTFEALGNIAAGVGKDKLPQLVLAFGQVRTAQKLTGNELRQFTEAGVPLLEELAKVTGKSAAQVKKDMEDGMAPSFGQVEEAIFNLTEEGGKFENLMGKQSTTVAGAWSNLEDHMIRLGASMLGVASDGEIAIGSIYDTLKTAMNGIITVLDSNSLEVTHWTSAFTNSIAAIIRSLFNLASMIGKIFIGQFKIVWAGAKDLWTNINNLVHGNFEGWTSSNFDEEFIKLADSVKTDATDIAEAWLNADNATVEALSSLMKGSGDLKKTSSDLSDVTADLGSGAKSAANEFESLGKNIKKAYDNIKKEDKDYKKSKNNLKDDLKDDLEDMETDFKKSILKMNEDFAKEMASIRADYNKQMVELQEQLTEDLAEIDEKFQKGEKDNEKDYRESIAQTIVDKQDEVAKLQKDMLSEESSEKRWEMAQQIKDIQDFLETHKEDVDAYGTEIQTIRDYQNLDEIDKLKFKNEQAKAERLLAYEEEKAERIAQYEEKKIETTTQYEEELQELRISHAEKMAELELEYKEERKERKEEFEEAMDDLKDSHKEKLKELKKHLKEVKKELEDFVNSKEYSKAKAYLAQESDYSARAVGGPISKNQPYLVGENGPELIIPNNSGRVIPNKNLESASQAGTQNNISINVDIGMYAGSQMEKRKLGQEILDAINQTRQARGLELLA